MVFSATPPTSPMAPFGAIVPVAAIRSPPVIETFDSASMIPRVIASPAEGPPMFAVLMEICTGNVQLKAFSR